MNVTYIFMDFQSLCEIFDLLYFCGNFKNSIQIILGV